jgi:cyclophilin family peptidyl-prolyl cis-trans isomerase/HEAT repeat protein
MTQNSALRLCLLVLTLSTCSVTALGQLRRTGPPVSKTPVANAEHGIAILIRIMKAEDERRWDNDLKELLKSSRPTVRTRAALAAGRIGDEAAVAPLAELLKNDNDQRVRSMAAFGLGEIQAASGADPLLAALKTAGEPDELRARCLEALSKIAQSLPREQEARAKELGTVIVDTLKAESERKSPLNRDVMLLGLTAVLRARAVAGGPVVAGFLRNRDPRVRADAANTLARLRVKDGNSDLRTMVKEDIDPVVRANAARVLGATEDTESFDALLDRAINDPDSRVRVSAIRSLASLKDTRAADSLVKRGIAITSSRFTAASPDVNEVLEIATTLSRLLTRQDHKEAVAWLFSVSKTLASAAPEVELALVRIAPEAYLSALGNDAAAKRKVQETIMINWKSASGLAAGLGEFAAIPDSYSNKASLARSAETLLRAMLDYRNAGFQINTLVAVHSEYAIPDVLRALAAFKPADLPSILRTHLNESDVIVRGTAADLLGETPPSAENTQALATALRRATKDQLNDAVLSTLDALGAQKTAEANEVIKTALDSPDHLIRRRAVAILKTNNAGDFSSRIGTVKTGNVTADYQRAISRMGKRVRAEVTTSKGSFTIELLPQDAPLNVDNFVVLAQSGYFKNIVFHRVVPNFVIQGGDPRGDGNGGPDHQVRCEINEVPYDRGAVGMALSAKDTGGSQWFVTHAPQPHLDGGYTVFGRVVAGMDVVDRIVRGDSIKSITIRQISSRTIKWVFV